MNCIGLLPMLLRSPASLHLPLLMCYNAHKRNKEGWDTPVPEQKLNKDHSHQLAKIPLIKYDYISKDTFRWLWLPALSIKFTILILDWLVEIYIYFDHLWKQLPHHLPVRLLLCDIKFIKFSIISKCPVCTVLEIMASKINKPLYL